jgi:outer membrane receptor for ferrienterochelin and colicins
MRSDDGGGAIVMKSDASVELESGASLRTTQSVGFGMLCRCIGHMAPGPCPHWHSACSACAAAARANRGAANVAVSCHMSHAHARRLRLVASIHRSYRQGDTRGKEMRTSSRTRVTPRLLLIVAVPCLVAASVAAQTATLRVHVYALGKPVGDAEVRVTDMTYKTDAAGVVSIPVESGSVHAIVMKNGFVTTMVDVQVSLESPREVMIELQPIPNVEETVTVVATTRTAKRLDDQPMRVEVLTRDEVEEKMLMTPGDIVMMLNEMGGMRVQATSPSLGAASVRIQGMRGRYTRVLSDGLPLFGDVGGLGLLQIPPTDLGRVEVIKGVASALYGAGAMGGVINLLSRQPGMAIEREFLVNRSTRGGTDAVSYVAGPLARGWSASLLGGGHWQQRVDVNDDAWADLPGYGRGIVRPRVFWANDRGGSLFATGGFTYEDRHGGTVTGGTLAATGQPYVESLETHRYDAGAVGQFLVGNRSVVSARAAAARQTHDHRFGEVFERDRHDTTFGEIAIRTANGRHTWVAGLALERDAYRPKDVPQFAYAFTVPGVFAQSDVDLGKAVSLSSSGRLDWHSEYGTFFSPRVSALIRMRGWTARLSVGTGFFAPTPITEETEAAGLTRLTIERPLRAERGVSTSFDLSRSQGPLSYTATVFASRVSDSVSVDPDSYVLRNLTDPTTNVGLELLATLRRGPYSATATYTYVRARETIDGVEQQLSLTPRHSAGVVGMWEAEDVGRIGVEWYYTGLQSVDDNPYRTVTEPYVIVGMLAEKRFGRVRLFVNGENLTAVRQTKWDPLLRPTRAFNGRWTVDAWAPLEGRNINGGLRVRF